MEVKEKRTWRGRVALGVAAAVGAVWSVITVPPAEVRSSAAEWAQELGLPKLASWLDAYPPAPWIFLFIGLGIGYWLFRSGDLERIANWGSRVLKRVLPAQIDLSGYTVLASGAIVPLPDNAKGLKAQPDKICPPAMSRPERLPEHEATLRLKALDEMHAAIIPPLLEAHAAAYQAVSNRRVLLLEFADGKGQLLTAVEKLREEFQETKKRRAAVERAHELHGVFPEIISGFPEQDRFHEGTRKFVEGVNYLREPITLEQVSLLEPWAYKYLKDIAQVEQWANDCVGAIKALRAETVKKVTP